jgi:hypothetical protein
VTVYPPVKLLNSALERSGRYRVHSASGSDQIRGERRDEFIEKKDIYIVNKTAGEGHVSAVSIGNRSFARSKRVRSGGIAVQTANQHGRA